jgi:hypothetical protein
MSGRRNLRDDGDIFDAMDHDADESANMAGGVADALARECLRSALPAELRRRALRVPLITDSCGQMFARSGDAGHLGTIARAMQDAFDAARVAAAHRWRQHPLLRRIRCGLSGKNDYGPLRARLLGADRDPRSDPPRESRGRDHRGRLEFRRRYRRRHHKAGAAATRRCRPAGSGSAHARAALAARRRARRADRVLVRPPPPAFLLPESACPANA